MKRFLLQLIICLTCFNLAGGYAVAASFLSQTSAKASDRSSHTSEVTIVKKKSGVDVQLPQIYKEESEDDDAFIFNIVAVAHSTFIYQFIPDFKLFNKYFLVHYEKAIKGIFPPLFLVNSIFRL
jgi:hypothetical protein